MPFYYFKNVERKQIETEHGHMVVNVINIYDVIDSHATYIDVEVPHSALDSFTILAGIDLLGPYYSTPLPEKWGDDYQVDYGEAPSPIISQTVTYETYSSGSFTFITNNTQGKSIAFLGIIRDEAGQCMLFPQAFEIVSNNDVTRYPDSENYGECNNPSKQVTGSWHFNKTFTPSGAGSVLTNITETSKILRGAQEVDTDPYNDLPVDGSSEIPGGSSISIPGLPPASATATGIIGLFAPTESQMQQLADFMWTDFGGTGTTVEDILNEVVQAMKRQISDPLNYILGLNIIPSQGLSIGATQTVKFGFVNTNVSMPKLASQYFKVDCGTVQFDALCGDTFLDYAPYSKFQIYLPFVGFRELDANDCVGHTIGVYYHGDAVTGGLTAYITRDGSVLYQFSGACAINVPVSSDNWGNTIAAAVQAAGTIIGSSYAGASAGHAVSGAAKGALGSAAQIASNPSQLAPSVHHSGSMAGSAGAMGVLTPFIIREAVRFHSTAYFNTVAGYPSHIYKQLAKLSGYTVVLDINLEGVDATRPEMDEIKSLLQGGVIL